MAEASMVIGFVLMAFGLLLLTLGIIGHAVAFIHATPRGRTDEKALFMCAAAAIAAGLVVVLVGAIAHLR